jgi:hypothetical protein
MIFLTPPLLNNKKKLKSGDSKEIIRECVKTMIYGEVIVCRLK